VSTDLLDDEGLTPIVITKTFIGSRKVDCYGRGLYTYIDYAFRKAQRFIDDPDPILGDDKLATGVFFPRHRVVRYDVTHEDHWV
jgi:hypothetical protein